MTTSRPWPRELSTSPLKTATSTPWTQSRERKCGHSGVEQKNDDVPGHWSSRDFDDGYWIVYNNTHGNTYCWAKVNRLNDIDHFETFTDPTDHNC
jgi:hypothetical protein